MTDYLNYKEMVEVALRSVVSAALKDVRENGLRGNHNLYISFQTTHPGVVIADYLRDKYIKEMTIVLQHQYWDLEISEDGFDVTLSFNNVPERLSIPFAALTGFADPSVQFGLQFQFEGSGASFDAPPPTAGIPVAQTGQRALTEVEKKAPAVVTEATAEDEDSDKVIPLDQFRKK